MPPCLLAKGYLLEFFIGVLEVILMEHARWLEAPRQSADKVVVEAPFAHLLLEQTDPGLLDFRTHL